MFSIDLNLSLKSSKYILEILNECINNASIFLKFRHKKCTHRSILSILFYLITPIDLSLFSSILIFQKQVL